jgi:pyruvate dehydrogenase E1 component subunit alpha
MAGSKITKQTYIDWYKLMLLIRRFEEKAGQMYGMQKIRGFCHLYIGQEAIAAGMLSATKITDPVITAYRDHGLGMARGITANEAMAELYGKVTGCTKGKGGSMHFFKAENNFFGGHGIVGGQIGLGTGLAFAEKYNETDNVCLIFMGDGAIRQGIFHEAINMAATWKLPVIYIIENNKYAMGTSVERSGPYQELFRMGEAFDMPSEQADGMHPFSVHKAIEKARKHCTAGKGPFLLELTTYRYKGHSMSDPAKYRTKEEVASYKKRDPINQVLDDIKKKKYLTEKQFKDIQDEVKKTVEESVKFAETSPFPPDSELFTDIYKQEDYPFITN